MPPGCDVGLCPVGGDDFGDEPDMLGGDFGEEPAMFGGDVVVVGSDIADDVTYQVPVTKCHLSKVG